MNSEVRIFVINLKRSLDRRKHMEKVMEEIRLPYEFVEAVDGKELSQDYVEQVYQNTLINEQLCPRKLTPNEIGCTLSHVKVYERIITEKRLHTIILEDDIIFTDIHAIKLFFNHITIFKAYDLIFLGFNNCSVNPYLEEMYQRNVLRMGQKITIPQTDIQIGKPTSLTLGAFAYFLTLEAAQKLLRISHPIRIAADYITGRAERYGLEVGICSKLLVKVLPESHPDEGGSNIGHRQTTHLSFPAKLFRILLDKDSKFYQILRKFYRKVRCKITIFLLKYNIKKYSEFEP